jgi:hypothetical protein
MGIPSNTAMADAVRTARDAVAELEEPLRTEGFKILLAKLISGGADRKDQGALPKDEERRVPVPRKKTAGTKKEKKPALPASTLRLDVEALKNLKSYCERFDLEEGTEHVAFVLANYARENTGLEFVTAADVAYLHRQLISQRLKVVAVNDPGDWLRALQWLTAPSRKKEWLEKSGVGFAVSNSGLLRFHEMEKEAASRKDALLS